MTGADVKTLVACMKSGGRLTSCAQSQCYVSDRRWVCVAVGEKMFGGGGKVHGGGDKRVTTWANLSRHDWWVIGLPPNVVQLMTHTGNTQNGRPKQNGGNKNGGQEQNGGRKWVITNTATSSDRKILVPKTATRGSHRREKINWRHLSEFFGTISSIFSRKVAPL